MIINQRLYRGTHGEAGEIGRSLRIGSNVVSAPKKVEDYCSEDAIINQISEAKANIPLNRQDVVKLFKQDDDVTKRALAAFADNVGKIIINTANSFDPDAVFLNSPLIERCQS